MTLRDRFVAFVAEQFPFAVTAAVQTFDRVAKRPPTTADDIEALREPLGRMLDAALTTENVDETLETTPGVTVGRRLQQAAEAIVDACDGFLSRESIATGLTDDERLEILRGMILTRAVDTRLKVFFGSGEVRYGSTPFQGKGFRSLGQEAIYAAGVRLRRGADWQGADGTWQGDVVAPLIRDLGIALAMHPVAETVRMVLSGQMGKAGPPMDGRDLHIGDFDRGILPATAPLSISSLTAAGMGLAFTRTGAARVALAFIGEGGSSLGEWHEAINLCAARRLPVVFCLQNNQTALSTPVGEQSAARVFADKAPGYGVPGLTIDGTDADAVAAAFAWAAERARAGHGPTLIELVAMRMCGHAHHDDMLYLGKEPLPSWEYPELSGHAYADPELHEFWRPRDPIPAYAARLEARGLIEAGDLDRMKQEAEALVEAEAQAVIAAPWPDATRVTEGVLADDPVSRHRVEILDRDTAAPIGAVALTVEPAPAFDKQGMTFLEAVMRGVGEALAADSRTFVFGQDVGGNYGNAFLLLRPLLEQYGNRILNSPLAEGAVLGACIGAALGGLRPIGEMQFNDFVATGFNQLVNNAAKTRYRWGGSVPMVIRMPWGGLRHAGPYHSQNTEPWFYRTPGLKICVPSTPHDARALMAAAVADPDPVLYYEHIALYRDPRIKQLVDAVPPPVLPVGRAALRRAGDDLAIISYGAYVHAASRVAASLAESGIEASVLDVRWLSPLDKDAVLAVARQAGRVLIVHEDSRTGGIGESLAATIQEEAFEWLDAPVRVIGALDTPVPYAPPLEEVFLPSEAEIEHAARRLVADRDTMPRREGWHGWDAYARFYDWENARTLGRRDVKFWQQVLARERAPALELGCGTGRLLAPLARQGITVTGVDRSDPMLARARARIRRLPRQHRPTIVRSDVRRLPFASATFGVVLAPYGMLQSLLSDRDLNATLAEAARVLSPGGLLGVDLVPDLSSWEEYGRSVRHRGRTAQGTTITLMEAVRQDRQRGLTIFDEEFIERRGRRTERRRFTLTFRTLTMRQMRNRVTRAGFRFDAVLGDYRGGAWDPRADVWIVLARKR